MRYVGLVVTDGPQPPEAVAEMNRRFPAFLEAIESRGVQYLGRELEFPEDGATVRVRDGEKLVTDGPFAETKEFVGGFDLLECADLVEAIELESLSPVAPFLAIEIRPFRAEPRLGPNIAAFGGGDDSKGIPYLLMAWARQATGVEGAALRACDAWRRELEARGAFILGGELCGPQTAKTLRCRDGDIQAHDGTFLDVGDFLVAIDVVRSADRQEAIEVAATHPLAGCYAIEVRPCWSNAAHEGTEPHA
ncbi:MAG TPA: YciI family protein [Solirubrobacteraceae bacterium]